MLRKRLLGMFRRQTKHLGSSVYDWGVFGIGVEPLLRWNTRHHMLTLIRPLRLERVYISRLLIWPIPCGILKNGIIPSMSTLSTHFSQNLVLWIEQRNGLFPNLDHRPRRRSLRPSREGISVLDLRSLIPSAIDLLLVHLNHHFVLVILGRS